MPKINEDYSRACIYQIRHNDELFYIGSSRNYGKRQYDHKDHLNNNRSKMKLYDEMRNRNLNWEDVIMSVLEEYPLTDGTGLEKKKKLEVREREHIIELKPLYNTNKGGRTEEIRLQDKRDYHTKMKEDDDYIRKRNEYYDNNKQEIQEKQREKRNENKEEYNLKQKEYRNAKIEERREKANIYRKANKEKLNEQAKESYERNKEAIKERARKYREANLEEIKRKQREAYHKRKITNIE